MRNIDYQTNLANAQSYELQQSFQWLTLAKKVSSNDSILLPVNANFDSNQRTPCQINDVRCCQYQDRFHFILPAYVKLTCQTITDIQLDISVAVVSSILIVNIFYGDLPREFVEQLEQEVQIRVSNRCDLYLKQDQFVENRVSNLQTSRNQQNKMLTFTVRAMLPVEIRCDVFWTPFESLYLRMTIKMAAQIMRFLGKDAQVHFNIMYPGNEIQKQNDLVLKAKDWKSRAKDFFSCDHYHSQVGEIELDRVFDIASVSRFNEYGVSRSSRRFQTFKTTGDTHKKSIKSVGSRFRKCFGLPQKQMKEKLKRKQKQHIKSMQKSKHGKHPDQTEQLQQVQHIKQLLSDFDITEKQCFFIDALKPVSIGKVQVWNIVMFEFKLFRHPLTTLIEVLIPAVFLALINLAIFFQEQFLWLRIVNIATLLIAYTTFLPTVRQRILPSPRLTLMEILLYSIMISSALCLLRSFLDRNIPLNSYHYNFRADACFIISITLLSLVLAIVLIGLLIRRTQTTLDDRVNHITSIEPQALERRDWNNDEALAYYKQQDILSRYIRYSNDFIQKESIFERLWLHRLTKQLINEGSKLNVNGKQYTLSNVHLQQFHQSKMLPIVQQFNKTYRDFFVFVNRILYMSELQQRLENVVGNLPKINQFYRQRKEELEKHIIRGSCIHKQKSSTNKTNLVQKNLHATCKCGDINCFSMVSRYRLARARLILGYIKLEEHIQEKLEFNFEEFQPNQEVQQEDAIQQHINLGSIFNHSSQQNLNKYTNQYNR